MKLNRSVGLVAILAIGVSPPATAQNKPSKAPVATPHRRGRELPQPAGRGRLPGAIQISRGFGTMLQKRRCSAIQSLA